MKKDELKKYEKEFLKTSFGKKTKFFSLAPFLIGILIVIASAYDLIILGDEECYNGYLISWTIALIGGSITTLMYGYFLKDFIKSKK